MNQAVLHHEAHLYTKSTQKYQQKNEKCERPILRKPSSYSNYKYNRVSSIVDMSQNEAKQNSGDEDGTCFFIVADRLETKATKVKATYVDFGVPKSVVTTVSNLNIPTINVPSSESCVYGIPQHDDCLRCRNPLTKQIHISTKEASVSSGVGSGDSSELDSPVPQPPVSIIKKTTNNYPSNSIIKNPSYTSNSLAKKSNHSRTLLRIKEPSDKMFVTHKPSNTIQMRNQSTQADLKIMLCSCCQSFLDGGTKKRSVNYSLNSTSTTTSSDSRTRDSGFSSPSSPFTLKRSQWKIDQGFSDQRRRPTGSPCVNCKKYVMNGHTSQNINYEKELLLARIKRNLYDPEKEIYLKEIKNILRQSGQRSFSKQTLPWTPIKVGATPLRGVLKHRTNTLLEEIQLRHNIRNLERARKEKRLLCPLKRNEIVDIIKQVRQCLDITQQQRHNPPLECKFQVHRKIKLKSFQGASTENVSENNWGKTAVRGSIIMGRKTPPVNKHNLLKEYQDAAGHGDIKKILELLSNNPIGEMDTSEMDEFTKSQPLHDAFKQQHYRTAILLLEAGLTDLRAYTEQRVDEFQRMMEIVNKNKKMISN